MFKKAYKHYVLLTLTAVYTLNFLDRSLIALLLQPIKEDLHLSDTQLGFLTGIAFGLFYATLGLPIARWADRGNRATITSLAIGLWGVTVMSCVFVTNYIQLVFARVAAAVGEAGCMPPTYSLIGDYFDRPAERTRAMAIYMLASPLSAVGFVAGGWLNAHYGWRATFFLMGIPGLLMAFVVKLTITDPRVTDTQIPGQKLPPMMKVLSILWRQRSSRHLSMAIILLFTMGLGLGPWYAAFMMRSHGMGTGEVGLSLGLLFFIAGIAGMLLGGYVSAHWFAHNERAQMRLNAVTIAAGLPGFALFLLLPQRHHALIALGLLVVVFSFFFGPTFALMQRLVLDEMRATAMAVVMLLANLIGMGIGPQVVGILSDLLMPGFGSDSLRYAMLIMSFVTLWAAYHFWLAGRTVREDLSTAALRAQLNASGLHAMAAAPAASK